VAYLVYQIGTLMTTGSVGAGFVPGLIVVIAIAAVIAVLIGKNEKRLADEEARKAAKKNMVR
jgi:ferrous iron transport protein B